MPKLCYDTLATLPNRPHFERFRASVEQMLAARGDDIAFMRFVQTDMDVFPYSKTEWQKMFEDYHLLLLEAMDKGIVLWDDGSFARLRERFLQLQREGILQRRERGWRVIAKGAGSYQAKH